jgi:hypothetical protein
MMTGGCLCGAIRWSSSTEPRDVHHCHCSMCRRWTGGGFATLVWFAERALSWHGEPARFRSSPIAVRAHCGQCGTPLFLKYHSRDDVALAAGTLDEPQSLTPTDHYGIEGRVAWADIGRDLPGRRTRETW